MLNTTTTSQVQICCQRSRDKNALHNERSSRSWVRCAPRSVCLDRICCQCRNVFCTIRSLNACTVCDVSTQAHMRKQALAQDAHTCTHMCANECTCHARSAFHQQTALVRLHAHGVIASMTCMQICRKSCDTNILQPISSSALPRLRPRCESLKLLPSAPTPQS